MAAYRKRCTLEEFDRIAQSPQSADKLLEYVGGELIETEPNFYNAVIAGKIVGELGRLAFGEDLGHLTGAGGGYIVFNERYFPKVGYVSKTKLASLSPQDLYVPIPPELAVEIIGPSDEPRDLRVKIVNYLKAGTTVWLVRPDTKIVEVYAPGQPVKKVGPDGNLDGGSVLPGFTLAVKDIFPK